MRRALWEKKPTRRQLLLTLAGACCLALAGADCLVAALGTAPLFPAMTGTAAIRGTEFAGMALGRGMPPGQTGGCATAWSATAPYSPSELASLHGDNRPITWWTTGSAGGRC